VSKRFLTIVAVGIIAICLLVLVLIVLPGPGTEEKPTPTVQAVASPTPTPAVAEKTPTPASRAVARPSPTPDSATVDSDGDAFPDQIEKVLGSDPFLNECAAVRKLKANVLVMLDAGLFEMQTEEGISGGQIVADALEHLAFKLPAGVNVGLMIVGGTRGQTAADPCSAIELIRAIGPLGKERLQLDTAAIVPSGQRPLAAALQECTMAFARLEGQENFIILVSRGGDTCEGNPAREARNLKVAAVEIAINTFGVEIDPDAKRQLRQISRHSGGLYYDVPRIEDLSEVWNLQNERLRHWLGLAGSTESEKLAYMRCVSQRMREFTRWARETGWQASNSQQFDRILKQLMEELQL